MQIKSFICAVGLGLLLAGCYTKDITTSPTEKTDFVVGSTYALKLPVFVMKGRLFPLGAAGTPLNMEELRARRNNPFVEGAIDACTRIVIRKIVAEQSPEVGPYTHVYGEVLEGEMKGRLLDLIWISERNSGKTFRDPKYFDEGAPP